MHLMEIVGKRPKFILWCWSAWSGRCAVFTATDVRLWVWLSGGCHGFQLICLDLCQAVAMFPHRYISIRIHDS